MRLFGRIRFTSESRTVFEIAGRAARRAGARTISTDHLFIGLLEVLPEVPGIVRAAGLDPSDVRREILGSTKLHVARRAEGAGGLLQWALGPSLSAETARVLWQAQDLATQSRSPNLRPQDLFFSLAHVQGTRARELLDGYGIGEREIATQFPTYCTCSRHRALD